MPAPRRVTSVPGGKNAAHRDGQVSPPGRLETRAAVTSTPSRCGPSPATELSKAALISVSRVTRSVHARRPLPLHAPPQVRKVEFSAGTGLRITVVPLAKLAVHRPPITPQASRSGSL